MLKRRRTIAATLTVGALASLGAGCGSSKKSSTANAPTLTAQSEEPAPQKRITISMGEFFFKPKDATASAGRVTLTAPNTGRVEHELVLLRTNVDPAKLKTNGAGEVNEDAYSGPGEIPDIKAGQTKQATLLFEPGTYVMICNLPGHYKAGMYGRLTVK
jgi:uncharacterized cupredoxin-like copper-binding protein